MNENGLNNLFISTGNECHPYQFACLTPVPGQPNCAPENGVCDRTYDCPDQSDEGFCRKGKYFYSFDHLTNSRGHFITNVKYTWGAEA